MVNKKAQITIFIIIAVVIVAAAVGIFIFRDSIFPQGSGGEFSPVYDYFEDCVEQKTLVALSIAGSQGGYIEVPEFEPGSEYAPFSSQLDFLGNPVPYWYYVSSNGVVREQVPSISLIERQLEDFLAEEVGTCDFSSFRVQGHIIDSEDAEVRVKIREGKVDVEVDMSLSVAKGDSSSVVRNHDVEVRSKFGSFYERAIDIYEKEKEEMFLENYAVDVLYNYAPVTGSELSCSPLVWKGQEVVEEIQAGLSANVAAIGSKADYFDVGVGDENVQFMYDPSWPTRIEVWPAENQLLIAEPIGLESGLGVLGFCYVPYHFVYDIYHPVLIQIYDDRDIFQFPVAVVIDKSVPRAALEGGLSVEDSSLDEFCNYRNTPMKVYTYDNALNPVEADIDFICLNQRCAMGKTEVSGTDAVLSAEFPQCVNGRVVASAEGYVQTDYYVSTNEAGVANVLMDKLYEMDLELVVGGRELSGGMAIVIFSGEEYSTTVAYPEQNKVKLVEDFYNVSVQVFSGSSLRIPASSSRQCVEVPDSGLFGVFGATSEECFEINLPAQTLDNALSAGGKSQEYILESDLTSGKISISVPSLPSPVTLDQVQQNYALIDGQRVGVRFS